VSGQLARAVAANSTFTIRGPRVARRPR